MEFPYVTCRLRDELGSVESKGRCRGKNRYILSNEDHCQHQSKGRSRPWPRTLQVEQLFKVGRQRRRGDRDKNSTKRRRDAAGEKYERIRILHMYIRDKKDRGVIRD